MKYPGWGRLQHIRFVYIPIYSCGGGGGGGGGGPSENNITRIIKTT
jgi:hypothetical protein